jgi:hypothetical protein
LGAFDANWMQLFRTEDTTRFLKMEAALKYRRLIVVCGQRLFNYTDTKAFAGLS